MDIKAYIESGILEQYVLGQLSAAEMEEVGRLAEQHAEIRDEITAIENALADYAEGHSAKPRKDLLPGILDKINALDPVDDKAEETDTSSGDSNDAKVVPLMPDKWKQWTRIAAALLILSLLGNLVLLVVWQNEVGKRFNIEQELADLKQQNNRIADELDTYKADYVEVNSAIAILNDINTSIVGLECVTKTTNSACTVYWNEESKEVYLSVQSLPEPDEDHQYQLWALKDGAPIDAGVFDIDTGLIRMKDIASADAFAVTLETYGGNPTPNLEQLQVLGELAN